MVLTRILAAALILLSANLAHADEITVFAAASTSNALTEVGELFAAKGVAKFSFAASSTLAKQVEQGAPAHLFVSADRQWMDWLAERKLVVADSRMVLFGNSLVLIAPADADTAGVTLETLGKALGNGRLAVGDPAHVPVGLYAKQALETLGQWSAIEPHLARAESVRAGMALVERGEAPFGIVYATDAALSKKVKVVATFPASSHEPIVYPVAIVAGHDTKTARAFLEFLGSPAAKGVFARYGFRMN